MKPGDLGSVHRNHKTPLSNPAVEYGILLTCPNEIGKMKIIFTSHTEWIHVTDINLLVRRKDLRKEIQWIAY